MKGTVVSDIPGRIRIRFKPEELGPEEFRRLACHIMDTCEAGRVTFNRLTGSLCVHYSKGCAAKSLLLEAVSSFDPDTEPPGSPGRSKGADRGAGTGAETFADGLTAIIAPTPGSGARLGGVLIGIPRGASGLGIPLGMAGLSKAAGALKHLDAAVKFLSRGKHGLFGCCAH